MAFSLWGSSLNSITPVLITNALLNANGPGVFLGTAGAEAQITLGWYASDGALTFLPNSAPGTPNKTLQFKDNAGNLVGYWRSDGLLTVAATVAGALTVQPVAQPSAGQVLFAVNQTGGTTQFGVTATGGLYAAGVASFGALGNLISAATASLGGLHVNTTPAAGNNVPVTLVSASHAGGTGSIGAGTIPGGYSMLELTFQGRSQNAGVSRLLLQINGDNGAAVYSSQVTANVAGSITGTNSPGYDSGAGPAGLFVGYLNGAVCASGSTFLTVRIPNYLGTSFEKGIISTCATATQTDGQPTPITTQVAGRYSQAVAIQSIMLLSDTGASFGANSSFDLVLYP